ncbi:hypothetical protein COOONC_02069 [Cooperia oncophora]
MTLTVHKKPIEFSAKTLNTLLEKYKAYADEVSPTGDDRAQNDEYSTASLVDKLEKEFHEARTKGDKKDLLNDIKEID